VPCKRLILWHSNAECQGKSAEVTYPGTSDLVMSHGWAGKVMSYECWFRFDPPKVKEVVEKGVKIADSAELTSR